MESLMAENRILFLDCVDSTNSYLKKKILGGELALAAVCACRQTAGRGRMMRRWESPEGGLYLSISFPVDKNLISPVFSCVAAGVTIAGVLREEPYSANVSLKWPNDIFADGRKLCGILSELLIVPDKDDAYVIIGIGINVNSALITTEDALYDAVSLMELKGRAFDISTLAEKIVSEFRRAWRSVEEGQGTSDLIASWCELSETVGSTVEILLPEERFVGKCVGVSDAFELMVESNEGIRRFSIGDCRTLRRENMNAGV